ncbi:hypothetical protein ANN_27612 [Periplaneta americana]|uniref:Uncharacterized protein n=1 Tax=Periplaneta americana TaxID=6978 RepID=A0ABQ8RWC4_PERAM|nr:hypothetical protein ANN_27612 [Periplaneta americana]
MKALEVKIELVWSAQYRLLPPEGPTLLRLSKATISALMDVIKTEPEVDPLAVQTNEDSDKEDKKYILKNENLLNLHISGIKTESVDPSDYPLSEVKCEETSVKSEIQEDWCNANTQEGERKVEDSGRIVDYEFTLRKNEEERPRMMSQIPTTVQRTADICPKSSGSFENVETHLGSQTC